MADTTVLVGNSPVKIHDNGDGTYSATSFIADGSDVTKGSKSSVAVTDPTISADEIALLKGLLKQLQGNGSGATPVSINGSLTKLSTDPFPVGQEGWDLLEYNTVDGTTKVYIYINGEWREI